MADENINKTEQPKKEKVISGTAKKRKSKWTDVFLSEDIGNVKNYIFTDVFIPNIKKLIHDIVTNGIDMILYHDTGGSSKGSTISRPSYGKFYKDKDRGRPSYQSSSKDRYAYSDVILESRVEAEEVIQMLDEAAQRYDDVVSVADLYDMVGLDHDKWTDNKYGWTRSMLRDVNVLRIPEGYLLKFPRPVPLD